MFENLRLFQWATEKPQGPPRWNGKSTRGFSLAGKKKKPVKSPQSGWFLDRNWDRAEGERLLNAKKFAQAETHLIRAVAEATAKKQSAIKRIHLILLLAEAQRGQVVLDVDEADLSKLTAAENSIRNAIQVAAYAKERELYIQCLDLLAEIFAQQGRYDAVERAVQEAIKLEAFSRGDRLRAARRVVRLGVARHRLGKLQDAIPVLEKAVLLHQNALGEDHPETADQLTELGAAYRADARHEEAQECLQQAMEVYKGAGLGDSANAIQALHHLAGSLEDCGDLEAAAAQYEKALTYKQRNIGCDLDDIAELQYGLGNLHISWKNYGRARELLYEALGNFKRRGGIRQAVTHETLAYVDECSGRYNDAVRELAAAGKIWEKMRPERTRELMRNIERRAELLEQLRKKGEASNLLETLQVLHSEFENELANGLVPPDAELEAQPYGEVAPAVPEENAVRPQPQPLRTELPLSMPNPSLPRST